MPVSERKLKLVNGNWAYVSTVTYEAEPQVKRRSRLDKDKSLTELFGGP